MNNMKSLIQFIKESLINESGSAVPGVEPIRGDLAKEVADTIISKLTKKFKCNACALGSTGKKGKHQTSGDIDIAVELPWADKDKVIDWAKKEFEDCPFGNIVDYLNVFNIGYRYDEDGRSKLVQVDFMFVDDCEWAKFVYHSPNFLNNESEFKGAWRSTLFRGICACAPVKDKKDDLFTKDDYDGSYAGQVKSFWKYTFSQADGLILDHKSYEGNKKPVKNAKVIKDDRKVVSKNINEILKICFGKDVTKDDCNSYESLLNLLQSDRYEFKSVEQLEKIKDYLFNNADLMREVNEQTKNKAEELFDRTIEYIKK